MKKAALLSLLTLVLALPTLGEEDERHQSYLSFEEGGTIVRSGEDNSEIEAHRNLPVYPGDEVITARRGRAEVRLSDGNIIGIDRASSLRFRSILDAFEGSANETVVELRQGKVAVHRTDIGRDHVRLDTDNASYVAEYESVYSVETDARGNDRVVVFDGSVEVRTRTRTTRLREGDAATIDDSGTYDLVADQTSSADDFERWFLRRAERFGSYNNRYMDRRLSYWSDDLDDHGRWVFVTGIGWSWRPFVNASWRPYYNGYWHHRYGSLTWVSYDPWGWGTHHYGRWAYDPGYGWVWVPGYGYSPAWVYWSYGADYLGWAPAGWWDCHRSYYSWAYQPYRYHGARVGFGFYGRVRINELDLRPWTFVDPRGFISNRVDRAALTTDAIKQRLGRNRDGFATISGGAARMTREEWNDPAGVIRRRGIGGMQTGRETGAPATDLTPFFRRDGEVSGPVRDRIVRGRGPATGGTSGSYAGGTRGSIGGSTGGSVAPIGTGSVAPIGRGSVAPITPGGATSGRTGGETNSGRVNRGGSGGTGAVAPPAATPDTAGDWRRRDRDNDASAPSGGTSRRGGDTWRNRVPRGGSGSEGGTAAAPPSTGGTTSASPSSGGTNDAPRRVIDRIGGARVYPRDGGDRAPSTGSNSGSSSRDRGSSTRGRESSGSRDSGSSTRGRDSGSRDSGSRDRGSVNRDSGSRSSGDSGRSSAPPPPPPPPPSRNDSGSSRGNDGGGRVDRDQ